MGFFEEAFGGGFNHDWSEPAETQSSSRSSAKEAETYGSYQGPSNSGSGSSYSIGGAGLEVKSGAIVHAAATTANGGVANLSPLCPGAFGPAGPDVANAGTVVPLPGFARSSSSDGPVRGGEVVSLVVEGQPADVPVLLASSGQARTLVTGTTGALLLELPHEDLFVLPPLDASGRATLSAGGFETTTITSVQSCGS